MNVSALKMIVLVTTAMQFFLLEPQSGKVADFKIGIHIKGDRVELANKKGCNFSLLSFNAKRDVMINENGMVSKSNNNGIKNSEFVFSYKKKGNQITLTGIRGVSWKKLQYNDDGTQRTVSQDGIR